MLGCLPHETGVPSPLGCFIGAGIEERKEKKREDRPTPVEWKRFNWAGGIHGKTLKGKGWIDYE